MYHRIGFRHNWLMCHRVGFRHSWSKYHRIGFGHSWSNDDKSHLHRWCCSSACRRRLRTIWFLLLRGSNWSWYTTNSRRPMKYSSTCRQILLLRTFSKRLTSCAPFLGVRSLCINGHRALVNGDMEQVRSNELNSLSLIYTNKALVPPFLDIMDFLLFVLGTTLKDS